MPKFAGIQEALLDKDKKIKDLSAALERHGKMIWRDAVYFQQSDGVDEGPFCPQCYDSQKKVIRLQTREAGYWECKTCDKTFYSKDFNPSMPGRAITNYDLFNYDLFDE